MKAMVFHTHHHLASIGIDIKVSTISEGLPPVMPAADVEAPAKRAKASHPPAARPSTTANKTTVASSSTQPNTALQKKRQRRPRLFQPFRALGLITNHIPFALTIKHGGKDNEKPNVNIIACVGTSWARWDAAHMTLIFVGQPLDHAITALTVVGGSGGRDSILATSGRAVHRFVRGQRTQIFEADIHDDVANGSDMGSGAMGDVSHLAQICAVGDNLISMSASGRSIYIWSLTSGSLLRRMAIGASIHDDNDAIIATSMLHPEAHVDKLLVGSTQGHLLLYNFRTAALIFTFSKAKLAAYLNVEISSDEGEDPLAIADLVQTPALDIVAVVFAGGHILLLNILYDEPVIYAHVNKSDASRGTILSRGSVSFRTDGVSHTMAVGTSMGDLVLFDLDVAEDGDVGLTADGGRQARAARLAHTLRAAHDGPVASVQFVQGQSLLITSGSDNAIKQWLFETDEESQTNELGGQSKARPTSAPRLLKSRTGHSAPPRLIRYVGEGGTTIVSAGGEDRSVRAVSVVRDSRSTELSQGSLQRKANQTARPLISLKLAPTTSLSHSSTRHRDWDDLVTTHAGLPFAQSWSLRNARIGIHQLAATLPDKSGHAAEATASCVSVCGNFAFIGNADGFVEMYNVQSGRYRRRYDTREERVEKVAKRTKGGIIQMREEKRRVRGSAVTGVVSDATNNSVAISTMTGGLYFFNFLTAALVSHVETHTGFSSLLLHRPTNLVAASQDDLTIAVFDMETSNKVRIFGGFGAKILDMTFSPDGRWLIATSLDSFVRTFDIPTGRLVDYFYTKEVATSVTFSPLGDFLATTHVASRGIHLWANRNQYVRLPLSGIDEDEVLQSEDVEEALPTLRGVDVSELDEEDAGLKNLDAGEAEYQRTYTSQPQLFVGSDAVDTDTGLVTLSTMPRSRWMTLLNLDVIKARNKPKEAPKKPERAPFFLSTGASSVPDSAINKRGYEMLNGAHDTTEPETQSRRLQTLGTRGLDFENEFSQRLAGALQDDAMDALFMYLNTLTTPALDAEIRSLSRLRDIIRFFQCMSRRLQQHLDFDAVQAMVAVALRVHSDVIIENGVKQSEVRSVAEQACDDNGDEDEGAELAESLRNLMAEQYRESNRVLDLVQYCMGSLAFVRDVPLI